MNTKIIAVRHGETEWNRVGRQQGHLDSTLTHLGLQQARALAEGLREYRVDRIYSSDLGRAVETATIISGALGTGFLTNEGLRERNLGTMQGMTKAEFNEKYPREWKTFEEGDPEYVLPNGESARQRYDRAVQCVEKIVMEDEGKTILLVTHGGVVMSLLYRTLRLPLTQRRAFSLFNGSINVLSISDGMEWRLETWGQTSHLTKCGRETLDDN